MVQEVLRPLRLGRSTTLPKSVDEKPTVVVVSHTYMHEAYVGECIESVLAQETDFRVQLRIHDDASTDDTWEVISAYVKAFPATISASRSAYRSFPRLPPIEAEINSPFIAFIDGDDFWTDSKKLQHQLDYMISKPHIAMTYHRSAEVTELGLSGSITGALMDKPELTGEEMRRCGSPPRSTIMMRRFSIERHPNIAYVNFDEMINVQASTFGGSAFLSMIGPAARRVHSTNAWEGTDVPLQSLSQGVSWAVISSWLLERGFEEDGARFLQEGLRKIANLDPQVGQRLRETDSQVARRYFWGVIKRFFYLTR